MDAIWTCCAPSMIVSVGKLQKHWELLANTLFTIKLTRKMCSMLNVSYLHKTKNSQGMKGDMRYGDGLVSIPHCHQSVFK